MASPVSNTTGAATAAILAEAPHPVYLDQSLECLSIINIAIFLASISISIMLGFNRLVAVPIIASICGALNNSLDWYAHVSTYSLPARRIALVFADICWGTQDAVLTLYSFFLLEKILRGRRRTTFISLFAILFVAVVGLRLTILILHDKAISNESEDDILTVLTDQITRAYFLALACLEVLSATFLLRLFYTAIVRSTFVKSNSGGLFVRLAHSSEFRVATLAGIGVTRAACFGSESRIPTVLDNAAYIMQNAFPIALLVDLLTTRVTKLQATVESGSSGCPCSCGTPRSPSKNEIEKTIGSQRKRRESDIGDISGKGTMQSLGPEYEVYVGKGWSVDTTVAPGQRDAASVINETIEEA